MLRHRWGGLSGEQLGGEVLSVRFELRRAIGQQAHLAAENFLDALAQHRPVVLADLEMPSQIEQGPLANFVAEAFGTHEAVGKVGCAGCGGTGLCASNEHIETIAEVGGGSNASYMTY